MIPIENFPREPNSTNSKSRKILILAFVILVLLWLFLFGGLENFRSAWQTRSLRSAIPDYFEPDGVRASSVMVDSEKEGLFLRQSNNESVGEGLQYTVNRPYLEVVKEYIAEMHQNGWVAVSGGKQTDVETYLRISKGNEKLFVMIKKSLENGFTAITVVPVI